MRFIGDVHGKYEQYKRIIKEVERSIQVGDMGVGFIRFGGANHGSFSPNPPFDAMNPGHEFIRGNHDNPHVCKQQKLWIPDGTVRGDMMLIGGAWSIDRVYRQSGYNWWPEEELTDKELMELVDKYEHFKPRIMVTHDCPVSIYSHIHSHHIQTTRTNGALERMFELHQPEYWIFGHHHTSLRQTVKGTKFICLNELEHIDLEVEKEGG